MFNTDRKIFICDTPKMIFQSFFESYSGVGQCDCGGACAPINFVEKNIAQLSSFNESYSPLSDLIKQPVNSKYCAILSPFAQTFAVLNTSAMACLKITNTLAKDGNLRKIQEQMLQLGLLVREDRQTEVCASFEARTTLASWLYVTDRCNLACTYCYLSQTNADMSLETGKAAITSTFRSAVAQNYQEVKFKYAGGEPLLRFPVIKELHCHAQQSAAQHGLALDGVVLSNGTLLTAKMVKEMQALGLRLMISLDNLPTPNPSQEGNYQRMYPDGRDASRDAIRGIELALECGLTPDISITVSGRNVQQLPELLDWVLARELPFSLNFYRDPLISPFERLRANGYDDLQLKEETFIAGMLAAYKVIEANLPQRSLLASLADMANFAAPHLRRCSVGHSYLVFDTEGRVSKCQMQMDRPVTDIHAEDPLAAVRADTCGIQNVTVDEKGGCQECQWRYWCAGGCPLEAYHTTGRYDVKSPNCNIYKALYPEVIRLEGLRLLKYAEEIEHG